MNIGEEYRLKIADLKLTVEKTFKLIKGKLFLPTIELIFTNDQTKVIPEVGLGASSIDKVVNIYTDASRKDFKTLIQKQLIRVLTHELALLARRYAVGKEKKLLDALVAEGLAENCDMQLNSVLPSIGASAISGEELEKMLGRAKLSYEETDVDFNVWFAGSEEFEIPKWAGYAVGTRIVEEYLLRKGKKAWEVMGAPSIDFIE